MKITPTRSSVRRFAACDFRTGHCAICTDPVIIKFQDTSTGWKIGDCCVHAAISAERVLSDPEARLRAPLREEFIRPQSNH
jgi:hypothetical protein